MGKQSAKSSSPPQRNTILIAEDDLHDMLIEAIRLSGLGYEIVSARRGDEAVAIARRFKDALALVIMDLRLPALNGIGAIRLIRMFAPDVPILALTAYGEPLRDGAMRAGATEFMVKGAGIQDVYKTIKRMLSESPTREWGANDE